MAHKRQHSLNGLNNSKNKNGEIVQTRRHSLNGSSKNGSKSGSKGSHSNGQKSKRDEFEQIRISRQTSLKSYKSNGERSGPKQKSKLQFYPLSDAAEREDFDRSEIEGLYENSGLSDYQTFSEFHENSLKMLDNISNLRHVVKSSKNGQGVYKDSKAEVKIDKNKVRSIVDTERRNSRENDIDTESFSESERYEPYVRLHSKVDAKVDSGPTDSKSGPCRGGFVKDSNAHVTKQSKSYLHESGDSKDMLDRKELNDPPSKLGMEYWVSSTDKGHRLRSFEGHHRNLEISRSEYSGSQKTNNLYNEGRYSREKSVKSDLKQDLKRQDSKDIDYGNLDIMFKHVQNDQFKMVMVSDVLNNKAELISSNKDTSGETVGHSKSEQVLSDTERRICFLESKEKASFSQILSFVCF